MSKRQNDNDIQKKCSFESLEERRVFSAQALAEVAIETQDLPTAIQDEILAHVESTALLQDIHQETGASYVDQQYGFDGAGQTVAIIDSGIAFDHVALGGGFGPDSRVVGGYDFAEGDSNPFDDGSAGFHGTHVAGIVGSTDEVNTGVSPGVDLVGLRVFDDAGNGNIEWVEQALQWVHDHKDDFENPITTVNLSLGTSWNSETPPDWGILENELQQLEMDGIFISVSAGNAFQQFGTEGLSYPASSPFVVPVASHGADGMISDFSQRAGGVLVAPGENIRSTVPDHLFGGTRPDSFLSASGTSQAAPYVAGASAIARQALEFTGVENIDQDTIYNIFRDTADALYDSVTGNTYHRLNLGAAIDAIVGDLHSDDFASATKIDSTNLFNGGNLRGTIGKVSDVDTFKFTAEKSGRVTLDIETTDDLVAQLDFPGTAVEVDGNRISFDVSAGQEVEFSLTTSEGIGHYQIAATIESTAAPAAEPTAEPTAEPAAEPTAVQWGGIEQEVLTDISVRGEASYEFSAERDGLLTVVVESQPGVNLNLYDAQMNEIRPTEVSNGQLRFDVSTSKGEQFFLRAEGSGSFDASLTNLVSLENGELTVFGTEGSDRISIDARGNFDLTVNLVDYQFDLDAIQQVAIDGQSGLDRVRVNLGDTDDIVTLGPGTVAISNNQFELDAENVERNIVLAGGGENWLTLNDSIGDDTFVSEGNLASLVMGEMRNRGRGFQFVDAISSGGNDTSTLVGTEGDDRFSSKDGTTRLRTSDGRIVSNIGFENTLVEGVGGRDIAHLFDSSGDDQFVLDPTNAYAETDFGRVTVESFERINAVADAGGDDSLVLQDSFGDDRYRQENNISTLRGNGFVSRATGFDTTTVVSVGGEDVARVYGSTGDDVVFANSEQTTLTTEQELYVVQGFERVNVIAVQGGTDVATLHGSAGDDRVNLNSGRATLRSSNGLNRAIGFDQYTIDGNGGFDTATLVGSNGDDRLQADETIVRLETEEVDFSITDFENQSFDGRGGFDVVALDGFDEDDLLEGEGINLRSAIDGTSLSVTNFSFLNAATDLVSRYDMSTVDYLFMLDGDWEEV